MGAAMIKRLANRSLLQLLLIAGTLLFTLTILAFLLYQERELLRQIQWRLEPWLIIGPFCTYLIGLGLVIFVWTDLMRHLGSTLPATIHIEYFCISQLAKRLPGTVWYIAGRSYLYKQMDEPLRRVTFASSVELLITFLSGVLTSLLFAGYFLTELTVLPWWGWLLLVALGLFLLHPRSLHYWARRFNISEVPMLHYGRLLLWVALYTLTWMIGGLILYFVGNLVIAIPIAQLPYLLGSWSLVGTLSFLVFFLPTNMGFSEVGLSLLLATIVPSALAVVVAVLNRLFLLICELVGVAGIVLLLRIRRRSEPVVRSQISGPCTMNTEL
jgi:glycosyltransferase 2 family protein